MAEPILLEQPKEFSDIDEADLWQRYTRNRAEVHKYAYSISEDKYRFWDKAKFKDAAKGFTKAESWYLAREVRKISSRAIPVQTPGPNHQRFTWLRLNYTDEFLRKIDMYSGGHFLIENPSDQDGTEKQKYLTRGIMEEAIASSQLEGSNTSRKYAKRMITENIKPRNKDDWMILNNYTALKKVEEEYKDIELSENLLLEMHDLLVENTMDPEEIGRFRKNKDEIVVYYGNKVAYEPPDEKFLNQEIKRLIKFANDEEIFIHPVIKGIILHFWIGYLHPFTDGNGRMARSLFYWYMLKNDYWAFVYLPISMIIKRAPKQYTYSFIYAEQDNFDFTYFYDYNVRKIIQSIEEFQSYVQRMHDENRQIEKKLGKIIKVNDRQKQLIHYLLADSSNHSTASSHMKMNGIARQTAYRDLQQLESVSLVRPEPAGRYVRYYASDKLQSLASG